MKVLLTVGFLLVLLGGTLLVIGSIPREEKHEAEVFGIEMSVTEKTRTPIPLALSGGIVGAGAACVIVALTRKRRG